jgi:SAM-dependent methyltransferase
METPNLNFGGSISQNYENFLGSFLFEPFAVDLASRVAMPRSGKLLELACGTGRLTKHLAARLPANVDFTASDLSADMLDVAKSKVTSDRISWISANMLSLPFENESFDMVVCQFAIMLVPDQPKALSEIFRILKKGGKVIFSTWSDLAYNRFWAIGEEVLKSFSIVFPQNPGPFALGDDAIVQGMLKEAGFSETAATNS